ncbi:diacylglycerol kinase epsilon, putative [Entamoeba invadens IP1]|uniref:Diacylglycerol kinase n=1 Tax=Entamoeba invadens IP1 TaxID=370355 RepID=A0A0A1U4R4_ENTIV|nr:diacylglycerol kinase epsilon, putative [Entamoeba invadens IP1]ELP87883.1 diacylglycerol kinase epsilon, putative [Entamoeba invadens IP1]|eukprot:XP_004254654.1 diacylglycerol kinase epsilon, putative [Entamoeba invadens IP1]
MLSSLSPKDFELCNLHINQHTFVPTKVISICEVCGQPITPFFDSLKCSSCGLSVHSQCSQNCYLFCYPHLKEKKDEQTPQATPPQISPRSGEDSPTLISPREHSHSSSDGILDDGFPLQDQDIPMPQNVTQNNCVHCLVKSVRRRATHCVVCRGVIVGASVSCIKCRICKIYMHKTCATELQMGCRPISLDSHEDFHWFVPGNRNTGLIGKENCFVCQKAVGSATCLVDFRCAYCGMVVHSNCIPNAPLKCYHGKFGKFIVTPNLTTFDDDKKCFVALTTKFSTLSKIEKVEKSQSKIEKVENSPGERNWLGESFEKTPIIFFVNKKSGNHLGVKILQMAEVLFSVPQVCDISDEGSFAHTFEYIASYKSNFIAALCGGDGTITWVLDEFLRHELHPKCFIIPLGTGNSLSRCTGWGTGYDGGSLYSIVKDVQSALNKELDRWKLSIRFNSGEERNISFNNYYSIGLDAGIRLDFHQRREANPDTFNSRNMNKVQYALSLPRVCMKNEDGNIDQVVVLQVDGKEIKLPSIEALIFINLPIYGGGIVFYDEVTKNEAMMGFKDSDFSDGLIEIVGIPSVVDFHLTVVGLTKPIKIAQGKKIEIILKERRAAQCDGEPFAMEPCTIALQLVDKANMLVKKCN